MKLLPNVTQRYVFSKITFKTLSAVPHSQNSIFQLDMLFDLTLKILKFETAGVEMEFLPTM